MLKGYLTWRVVALLLALLGATVVVPEAVPVIINLLEGRDPCHGLRLAGAVLDARKPCEL